MNIAFYTVLLFIHIMLRKMPSVQINIYNVLKKWIMKVCLSPW